MEVRPLKPWTRERAYRVVREALELAPAGPERRLAQLARDWLEETDEQLAAERKRSEDDTKEFPISTEVPKP